MSTPSLVHRALLLPLLVLLYCLPLPALAASLWYATENQVLQIDSGTLKTLTTLNLSKAKALAVNADDASLYALTESKIYKYAGSAKLWEKKLSDLGLSKGSLLAADATDGSLWLAHDKKLVRLDAQGNKLASWSAKDKVKRIALAEDQSLWLLSGTQLLHYSPAGALLASKTVTGAVSEPKQLAFDALSQYLWVAGESQLARYQAGNLNLNPLIVSLPDEAEGLALDGPTGALWVQGEERLVAYDKQGLKFFERKYKDLGLPEDEVEAISYEPAAPNLWLGYENGVAKFDLAGQLIATIKTASEIKALGVMPYAQAAPALTLIFPAPGALINAAQPTFIVGFCEGCRLATAAIAPYTLNATLNGQPVGHLFVYDAATGQSTYTPAARLPEGRNTFTAQAFDLNGAPISNILEASFTLDTVAPVFVSLTPASGSVFTTSAVTISGTVDDALAQIVLNGLAGPVAGPSFSFPVTLAPGLNTYTLSATDPAGNSGSASLSLTYSTVNQAPSVSLTAPAEGALYTAPATITITATASDDGGISQVGFYQNGVLLNTDNSPPYSYTWANVAQGSYTLTAVATDNAGLSTTSSPVTITVSGPNAAPSVSLTNPADGAVFYLPATITLTAMASDTDGTIGQVGFYQGATLIGSVSAPPYTLNWAAPAGTHSLTAKASDNLGASTVSSPVTITVKDSITYLHNDIAGNPIAATDSAGTMLWKENFRPFGERLNNQAAAANNRQWFHRKAQDADTGLSYFGARYYDPILGRFMGVDAEGVKEDNLHSFNRYAYGHNNPYRYIDPDGRYAEDLALGIPSLAIGAKSFVDNVRAGNWGSASVDVAGMMADAAAIALPGVPGGIGLGIKATRESVETATRGARNLPFKDADRLTEVNKTLDRIETGGPFPYKQDGKIFRNKEGKLPDGDYREYTVDTPGASNRGKRRVVQDKNSGRTYYSDDHYNNFTQIDPKKR